jgi:hypothetical protein
MGALPGDVQATKTIPAMNAGTLRKYVVKIVI